MSFNPFSLANKRILITGGSSGIGRATAIACSKMGADIILIARDIRRLEETMQELSPGRHAYVRLDLTDYEKIENTISECVEKYGQFDGLVHSAGSEISAPIQFLKPMQYEKIISVNLISGFELSRVITKRRYFNPEGGSLVFISSIRGVVGKETAVAYSCSKGAIISGVRSMALEMAKKNIRVNSISPSIVETDMTRQLFEQISDASKTEMLSDHPLGFGRAEDVAYACIYLQSDASVWITGSNLIVDGGYSAR
ncbi:MAG: SDR family oxidoreductase [Clostridiaceae bacterium]|nr:SDR family oxidoreductase [Clostridiaceae bacterium]